ncbi:MAG: DUF1540 domain-containing protein [Gammaproteobacteria bacterium]|jgi:hypothetical protein
MNFTIEMPEVKECGVTKCVYNLQEKCHARAITIGDGVTPNCDTFHNASPHTKEKRIAGVGACKVAGCTYNSDYECQANGIVIGIEDNQAKCLSYNA